MPRQKKVTIENNTTTEEVKPEPIVITVPTLGVISQMGFSDQSNHTISVNEKEFSPPKRIYSVYSYGEFIEDIDEESEKIDSYLEQNKSQLDHFIEELNELVSDPNILIYFHEGKQNRQYLSFESYYAQNGLAPKSQTFHSWMQFYKYKFPNMSDEEIAIKVKGNLQYSFTIKTE